MSLISVLLALLLYAGVITLAVYILYLVIKAAVKNGILEAHEELDTKE